jgi:hypothetical protein
MNLNPLQSSDFRLSTFATLELLSKMHPNSTVVIYRLVYYVLFQRGKNQNSWSELNSVTL